MLFSSQTASVCEDDVCTQKTVKNFQSYNMGLFVLYYETFGYDIDREVIIIVITFK